MIAGQRVGDRYKIVQQIGGGGMSIVYLAHDIILNRDVAIKILRYDFSNEEELHKRFQREALSATSLVHPNIVSVYDVGDDQDMHYIVMEYIKGKTLKQYIQEYAPLSPARSVHIMKQLVSAIAHAHENGIIHRDIKPQNILVDEHGNVKITDFGIAMTLQATSLTQTNAVMGTVHYLSPEQARGGVVTKKTDIYSLGIVLYELLTGELPFSGESAVSIALKHLQSETPSVRAFDATIPQSVENIVLKATAKDVNHRYNHAEEMLEDLETALSPARAGEPKYLPPIDDDATRAIPIIKEKLPISDIVHTRPVEVVKQPKQEQPKIEQKPKNEIPSTVTKKKRKKWPFIVGALALLMIVIIGFSMLVKPNKVEIPDVSNMTVDEAIDTLQKAGFVIGEQKERNHETIEEGLVIETDPKAGIERVKGEEVDLFISLGNETTEMVDYVGRQRDQVVPILEAGTFEDIVIEEVYSEEPAGTILEQEPAGGEDIIEEKTTVTLTISKGRELVTVSDLTSFNEAALKEYAKSNHFTIKQVGSEHSEDVPEGSVVSQKPSAGTKVEPGSTIQVILSKGPAAKVEKTFYKTIEIPYEPAEEGAEQTVRIYIQDKTHSMISPFEELTISEPTTYRVQLVIVEGETGAYRIDRDSTVIAEETIPYSSLQ